MMEALARKKRVRGGHKASVTQMISQIYEVLDTPNEIGANLTKLVQCKLALEEKLAIVKHCDSEILKLV